MTRFRRKWLNPGIASYTKDLLQGLRKYYPDWEYIETGTDEDRIHLHMVIPPKYAVAKVVEIMKSKTSFQLKKKFPLFADIYWDKGGIWSIGYFVSTIGLDAALIRRYVAEQGKEDEGQAQLDW